MSLVRCDGVTRGDNITSRPECGVNKHSMGGATWEVGKYWATLREGREMILF